MIRSHRWLAFISLLLLFCGPPLSRAHEEITHQVLGDVAALYLYQNLPTRPKLTGSLGSLQSTLRKGAAGEDDDPLPNNPRHEGQIIGRYYFHFAPQLNSSVNIGLLSAVNEGSCASDAWGLLDSPGCSLTCDVFLSTIGVLLCSDHDLPEINQYRWSQDLQADINGAPSTDSIRQLGYIVHLLEDLGSPAHTRNDLHPCPYQVTKSDSDQSSIMAVPSSVGGYPLPYCDVFEKGNVGRLISQPTGSQIIDTTPYSSPGDFFEGLRAYTNNNYFSNGTAFTSSGPTLVTEDDHYFYGACIEATVRYGHCEPINGNNVRKIASKGPLYYASCIASAFSACLNTLGGVDLTVAQEQFDELGPVIAQHVASFLQFYSPALTISSQGTGTGSIVSKSGQTCTTASMPCPSLLTRTTNGPASVVLTAQADPGSTFVSWSGASGCSGTDPSVTVSVTKDDSCAAIFSATSSCNSEAFEQIQSWSGTITVNATGSVRHDDGYGYYDTASLNSSVSAGFEMAHDLPQQWQGAITPSGSFAYTADTYFNFPSKDFTTEWNYTAAGSMNVVGPGLQKDPGVSIQMTIDAQACTYNLFVNDEVFGTETVSSRQPDGSVQTTTQNNAPLIWGAYPGVLQITNQPIPATQSTVAGSLNIDLDAYVDVATLIPAHVSVNWILAPLAPKSNARAEAFYIQRK